MHVSLFPSQKAASQNNKQVQTRMFQGVLHFTLMFFQGLLNLSSKQEIISPMHFQILNHQNSKYRHLVKYGTPYPWNHVYLAAKWQTELCVDILSSFSCQVWASSVLWKKLTNSSHQLLSTLLSKFSAIYSTYIDTDTDMHTHTAHSYHPLTCMPEICCGFKEALQKPEPAAFHSSHWADSIRDSAWTPKLVSTSI